LNIPPRLLEVLVEEGELLVAEREYAKAAGRFNEALTLAQELGDMQEMMASHRQLSFIHEQLGDIPAAFAHHRESDRIRVEILGQERQNEVVSMQMRYEVEKAEQERELLKLKNQQLHLEMQTRMKELTSLAMQLVQKNEMLDELKQQIASMATSGSGSAPSSQDLAPLLRQIESTRNTEHEWEVFEEQFRALHPEFMDRMAREFPELSPTELKVCALLKINLATKDIANILCCSTRTVEDHRYAIRTKIGLPKGVNLTSHLMGMG
jgi:DNA-binding CsgD family transcriptional regulator